MLLQGLEIRVQGCAFQDVPKEVFRTLRGAHTKDALLVAPVQSQAMFLTKAMS